MLYISKISKTYKNSGGIIMRIETDKDAINFLNYLVLIKKYDASSNVRVVEKPNLMDKVYDQFVEDTNNGI